CISISRPRTSRSWALSPFASGHQTRSVYVYQAFHPHSIRVSTHTVGTVMNILIPIPEAASYGIAILVICSFGSLTAAQTIYFRWFARSAVGFPAVYTTV